MAQKIELGDEVECKITGYKGIVVARTEYFNGCVQFIIAPPYDKKNPDAIEGSIDEQSLKIIKKGKVKALVKKVEEDDEDDEPALRRVGGPSRRGLRSGY